MVSTPCSGASSTAWMLAQRASRYWLTEKPLSLVSRCPAYAWSNANHKGSRHVLPVGRAFTARLLYFVYVCDDANQKIETDAIAGLQSRRQRLGSHARDMRLVGIVVE